MIKAKIIGAGGYGGVGITELLLSHSEAGIQCLVDVADVGLPISKLYPHLQGFCDEPIHDVAHPRAQEPVDVVFMATPDGVGMKLAPEILKTGAKIIDYSGDFRFNSAKSYAEYATRIGRDAKHASPELLPEAVYGLTEMHRKEIGASTRLIGNPGCFAVSCILGLAPAVKNQLVELEGIICDCKTGVSGAGKKISAQFHYPGRYENMNAYKLAGHQHVCEIERELGLIAGKDIQITFTAQVVPLSRGIMSCLYGKLVKDMSAEKLLKIYQQFYRDDCFVRVLGRDAGVGTVHVRGTNFCNLIVDVDSRTQRLRVISHIDNLIKGQAGSALQNMNLMFGFPENTGLNQPSRYP